METEQIKVLLVDDDQGDFEMIRVMLAKAEHQEYALEWVSSYEEAMDAFDAAEHDVYFLDYFLEDRTGLDLLREARGRGITSPIIMLTGRGSRKVDMEAMELGASDYLVKGLIDPDALERAIRHALERAEGAQAVREKREREMGAPAGKTASAGPPASGPVAAGPAPNDRVGDAARFQAIFQATRSGVALIDLEGRIHDVNPSFAGLFSPALRWTEGISFVELLNESDKEPVAKELEALANGEAGRFEAARRFMTKDGEVFWTHTTMALIRNDEGHPDQVLVVVEKAEVAG